MTDEILFAGLEAHEKAYALEAMERWEPKLVRESHRRYNQLTPEQKKQMNAERERLQLDWAELIDTDPAAPAPQALVARWRQSIEFFWSPDAQQLVHLAEMYNSDVRFRANYDKVDPRLAEYILACVRESVRA